MKKSKVPKIKKKVNAFLVGEEGKISKQSLMKVGAVLTGVALGGALSAAKAKAGTTTYCNADGSIHSSHASHASHGSHGSHSNHSSGGWC